MVVPPFARAAHGTGGEQLLDPLEGGPVDERFVASLVGGAVPLDDADVGPMSEQTGETRDGDGFG